MIKKVEYEHSCQTCGQELKPLSKDDINNIRKYFILHNKLRDYLMFEVILYTGMTSKELINVQFCDIALPDNKINEDIFFIAKKYMKEKKYKYNDLVFNLGKQDTVWNRNKITSIIKKTFKAIKIKKHPHLETLRITHKHYLNEITKSEITNFKI